ncbi:MAG: carbohydrate-binding domain-containing protein [Muribaculaceae bacterium]|nr:carbohydrate-binding domain-containing protein [Muribaculaceae bacterium]
MKGLSILSIFVIAGVGSAFSQTLHVSNRSVTYSFPASDAGEMIFSNEGKVLKILGRDLAMEDGTEIWTNQAEVEGNVVTIIYSDDSASVDIAGNVARYVEATVNGAHVSITQSPDVSENTCGEITYRLSGSSPDGSLYMEGSYKSSIEFLGLNLSNSHGAAIDVQNGKRISMSVKSGTVNELADGAAGNQKGCIVCKGHLEFKGKGELTVSGNASHAIYAKEYVEMKNCTVNIISAVKDGVNCNQYFLMESGKLKIDGTGDDGIQVSYKDSADREAEDTGSVTIKGGELNVNVTADAAKGIKCEGPMLITEGTLNVSVSGNGIWDSSKSKTKASASLASDEDITIEGGNLNLMATGGGGKGINCDGRLTINGGAVKINTSGGVVAYVNNNLYTNYTGNTDRLASDMKSSPKGIKADGDVEINGGEIKVVTTGNGAEGIESKSTLTINDGNIYVESTDDAINSSSHLYIKGGTVTVIASGNDGLDSNGNLYIEGGYIMAFGASSPECGIDANEEEGYTVIFTGGTLLAVGGNNSVPSSKSGSVQPYVSGSNTVSAGMEVSLTDSAGEQLATFTVPANYKTSGTSGGGGRPGGGFGGRTSVLVTAPGLENGKSYTLKTGTSQSNVTARLTGSSSGPGGRP